MLSNQKVIRLNKLQPGMIVAKTIVSETGKVLLGQGTLLTGALIAQLIKWQVTEVAVAMPTAGNMSQQQFTALYETTLESVARHFESVRAFQEVPVAELTELVDSYLELMVNVAGVVDRLYKVQMHNEYTFQHSLNVAVLSGVLGKWMGFSGRRLKELILAGLLHDIGKTLVPAEILNKASRLSGEEMNVIRAHSAQGYQLLQDCKDIPNAVKLGVCQHHEREDGSGYPFGLRHYHIHIYAKIVAVADSYDAMSSERVYRPKMPPFQVIEILLEQLGKLNTQVCVTLLTNIRRFLLGSSVLLSDGKKATIVELNDMLRIRPIVQNEQGEVIDLARREDLEVVTIFDEMKIS